MTASRNRDYEFFSQTPWPPSWQELRDYRVKFGKGDFSVIVKIEDSKFTAFIEKIPSANQDNNRRNLFYVVAAQGVVGDNGIANAVKKIAASAVSDIAELGKVFDREFPADYISNLDNCRHTPETESAIQAKLISLAKSLSEVATEQPALEANIIKIGKLSDEKVNFLNALNLLTSEQQMDGVTFLTACSNKLNDDSAAYLTDSISSPAQGLIISDNIAVETLEIKKKSKFLTTESPTISKSGSKKKSRILTCLLIISVLTNCILISSRQSKPEEKTSSLMARQDSINLLKSILANKDDSLATLNGCIDSLNALQCFNDTATHTAVKLDIADFSKSGVCKMVSAKASDTVSIYTTVDFVKNKCTVRVYKKGESKGSTVVNLK